MNEDLYSNEDIYSKQYKSNKWKINLKEKLQLLLEEHSGIGLATAKRFVAEGAYVFITGLYQCHSNL